MNILASMPGMFENSWHDFYKFRERVGLKEWFSTGDHFGAHLTMPGDNFLLSEVRGCRRLLVARDAAKHHTMHRVTAHNKALSGPRCQECRG